MWPAQESGLPLAREEGWELHPIPIPAVSPYPPPPLPVAWKSEESTGKRHSSGETAVGFSESLRTGGQRTQAGKGKIQDDLERKEKLKRTEYIYNSNKND